MASGEWITIFAPYLQLYRASALFETIRHEAQLSTDYKLSLFDLQTSSYQALQRVLVSLGESSWGPCFACALGYLRRLVIAVTKCDLSFQQTVKPQPQSSR